VIPQEVRTGLFIVESESVRKITGVKAYRNGGDIYYVLLESADGVTEMVENTLYRNNVDLAIEKWRLATDDEMQAWRLRRVGYPVHWMAD
jgi:hypothetical protein